MTVILPTILEGEDKSSPFINKIRNNTRHIKKWAKRTNTDCFRIFDREVRPYPIAIDFYAGRYCIHYFSPYQDDDEPSKELYHEVENALLILFGAQEEQIFWRTRSRSKETRQYEKIGTAKKYFVVQEHGVKFWVNLTDYLDTGLFLDHRETRKLVGLASKDKRILNLFSYTGSFAIHAALGGASYTKSVDMSNTYTAWNRDNIKLNELSEENNEVVRADCLKYLDEELLTTNRYDIIVIDPPTISRSKKMDQMFDIQYDYINLLSKAIKLLLPKGVIYFSTNSRRFVFDAERFENCTCRDISEKTHPIDFHDPKIHRCWLITT